MPAPPDEGDAPREPDVRERGRQLERVNAFSDGVFAIAATLLVLGIEVPDVAAHDLGAALDDLIRPLVSYFVSFAVVGIFWYHHHRLLGRLAQSDVRFATLNLVFLAFIALLPAPTELLGRYDETAPIVIYALNVIALSVLSLVLARYADTASLTDVAAPDDDEPFLSRYAAIIAFGLSIPVAFVAPHAAIYVWLLAALLPNAGRLTGRSGTARRSRG